MVKRCYALTGLSIVAMMCCCCYYVGCTYRQDMYKYFDSYVYNDMLNVFEYQKEMKQCTPDKGPNCFYVSSYNKHKKEFAEELFNDTQHQYNYTLLKHNTHIKATKLIKDNAKQKTKSKTSSSTSSTTSSSASSSSSIPLINSDKLSSLLTQHLINLNLFLTFESYDEEILNGNDMYFPAVKPIETSAGLVTIITKGKLRLTADRTIKTIPDNIDQTKYPYGTYGIIEGNTDLTMSFENKDFTLGFIYARCPLETKKPSLTMNVKGTKGNKVVYSISKQIKCGGTSWTKVDLDEKKLIDTVTMTHGFEIDNISTFVSMYGGETSEEDEQILMDSVMSKYKSQIMQLIREQVGDEDADNINVKAVIVNAKNEVIGEVDINEREDNERKGKS